MGFPIATSDSQISCSAFANNGIVGNHRLYLTLRIPLLFENGTVVGSEQGRAGPHCRRCTAELDRRSDTAIPVQLNDDVPVLGMGVLQDVSNTVCRSGGDVGLEQAAD